MAAGITVTAV